MKRIVFVAGILVFWGISSSTVWANTQCRRLFGQGSFEKAALCFQKAASAMGAGASLSDAKKIEKGRLLRNAALSFARGATKAKRNRQKAAWMRERAVKLLTLYDREGLYESGGVRKATASLRKTLRGQVGYASLNLVTNSKKASAAISGYRYSAKNTGLIWNLNLRPGKYKLKVSYPGGKVSEKSVELGPYQRKTLVLNPPVSSTQVTVVTSDAKALIQIDGGTLKETATQQSALWIKKLNPGSYTLRVTYPGQPVRKRKFTLKTGKSLAFVFNPPGPPAFRIFTKPDGASVYVDGNYRGKTGIRLELKPGKHVISLRRTCFLPIKQTVNAKLNKEKRISLTLKRDPAYLAWKKDQENLGGRRTFGWIMLATGVVIGGVGGGMYGAAGAAHSEARQNRTTNYDVYQAKANEGNTFRTVGHISVGVGGAALIAGMIGLISAQPTLLSDVPCKVKLKDD